MKTYPFFLFFLLFFNSCQPSIKEENAHLSPSSKKVDLPVNIKNIVIDSRLIHQSIKKLPHHNLSELDRIKLSIDSLDEIKATEFNYVIVDTLVKNTKWHSTLIARLYIEENIIWLANYTNENKLLSYKQVYYDNSEGSINVQSTINKNEIQIYSVNEFDDLKDQKKKFRFFINQNGIIYPKK